MADPQPNDQQVTANQVRSLAAAAGVDLSEERAAILVPQAVQHFALLRTVSSLDSSGAEPAAEFRLDARLGTDHD